MMKRCKSLLVISLFTLVVALVLGIQGVEASDNSPDAVIFVNDPNASILVEEINEEMGYSILSYDSSTSLFRFSNSKYSVLNGAEKKKYMEYALNYIRNSSVNTNNRVKVYNFVSDQDSAVSNVVRELSGNVHADFLSGWSVIRPFTGSLNFFLGVFVWLVLISFMLRLVLDMLFLAEVPLFDLWMSSGGSVKSSKRSNKPFMLTQTAWNVHLENIDESSSTRLSIYFGKSLVSLLIIGFMIVYLISGKIFDIVLTVVQMLSGAFM